MVEGSSRSIRLIRTPQLIEEAIRAKFEQNRGAMEALLATEGMTLTHNLGHPDPPNTSLPATALCDILTRIREETLDSQKGIEG